MSSCKTDFNVNAPYKEEYVVYGLLELNQPTQIIKIERVFQNNSSVSASQAAQIQDSLNTPDYLVVKLVELQNGVPQTTTSLTKYYDTHKDPGTFAAPGQYLYNTPQGFALNKNSSYKLTMDNPKTGYHGEATTTIVNDINNQIPKQGSEINLPLTGSSPIEFTEGANATSYDVNIRIPYSERDKKTFALLKRDTLEMNVLQNYTQQGGTIIYYVQGTDFYTFLASSLKADTSIYRNMDSLQFIFTGAGIDLTNYIEVNIPSIGIAQKKPDYTNVSNGLGIFSSRLTSEVKAPLSDKSFAILQTSDITKALNFR